MTTPRTIKRLLENGEPMRPTDKMLNTKFEWIERGPKAASDVKDTHHHPTYREETVLLEGELTRDQFAAAAMCGFCAQTETVRKAVQKTPGAGEFDFNDTIARMSYEFADSMIRAREAKS